MLQVDKWTSWHLSFEILDLILNIIGLLPASLLNMSYLFILLIGILLITFLTQWFITMPLLVGLVDTILIMVTSMIFPLTLLLTSFFICVIKFDLRTRAWWLLGQELTTTILNPKINFICQPIEVQTYEVLSKVYAFCK